MEEGQTNYPSYSPPQARRGFSVLAILGEAWGIYTEKFTTLIGIMLVFVLVAIISVGIVAGVSKDLLNILLSVNSSEISFSKLGGNYLLLIFGLVLVAVVVSILSTIALILVISEKERNVSVLEAYNQSLYKLIPFTWVSIIFALVVFFGFLLLIVPGVIFAIWFCLAPYIVVIENLHGVEALRRSHYYVRDNGINVFAASLLFLAISSVLNSILELITRTFLGGESFITLGISWLILQVFFNPFSACYSYRIYVTLKDLKERQTFHS